MLMLVIGYVFGRFSAGGTVIPRSSTANSPQATAAPAPSTALAALNEAAEQSPENAAAWTSLGNAYSDAGRSANAIDACSRRIAIQPD